MLFLQVYLQGRSIAVKPGNTISSMQPIHIGLTQGSVSSPRLYNAVMACAAPYLLRDPLISATVYADDVCCLCVIIRGSC